jgi:pimeloyl-ACP methyl ester carboxylesterase
MSRVARTALAATAVFVVSGTLSGLLIDEYDGVAGALEWVLRTLVVISAAVALGAAFVLVLRLRRRVKPRPLGWALTVGAAAAFAFFVVQPVVFAVYLTHLPARRVVHDADLGAPKQPVTLTTSTGLPLRGWYVPSRNGAAVAVMHGTGSNRLGVADHARLLARHGYGVLIFDLHGHGESDGRSTSLPARFQPDADAALAYLRERPDVRAGQIGIIGVSLGGEVAIHAAARHPEWRATVLEGVQGGSPADMQASKPDPATFLTLTALYGLGRVLGGSGPQHRGAREPGLQAPGRHHDRALEPSARASHAAALRTDPASYERHVIDFLDRALR